MIRMKPADARRLGLKPAKAKRGPNKWESEYGQLLEIQKAAGEIVWYGYEAMKFRLAAGTYYKPDWVVCLPSGRLLCIEVKGFLREAARLRFNVVRELYPFIGFRMVRKLSGGNWIEV